MFSTTKGILWGHFEHIGRCEINRGFNPIQAGGGGAHCASPTGFSPAVPKRFLVDR